MRISDWSSDVCSSDLGDGRSAPEAPPLVDHPVAVESVEPAAIVDRHDLVGKVEHRRLQREMLINGEVDADIEGRSEEHTSELQSLMRVSYAVFCLKKKNKRSRKQTNIHHEHNILSNDDKKHYCIN